MSAEPRTDAGPLVVGIGGTMREGSTVEIALRAGLRAVEAAGGRTRLFGAADLDLPMYAPEAELGSHQGHELVEAVRGCDGLLIGSPGYHGGTSGLVKNALDYLEALREDQRPYLDGRAVGLIVCAHGWQATTTTLASLRSVVHALRGWPTPLGVTINSAEASFADGKVVGATVAANLEMVGRQVVDFARMTHT
ncbi:MAG TPA: NADPH-dependent FMN reductase [Solirubrobacterales bacterium]|nr:NADPH-dependent FMN reductase [Solirubrobacterales bacterium]